MTIKKFFRLVSFRIWKIKNAKLRNVTKMVSGDFIEIPEGDIVAISMALHLFFDEVHDDESNVITIKRIERRYSPWISKIYGINNIVR